jgi:hypothetical protein
VIQRVADTIPERIKWLVFLDALVAGNNQSVVDVLPAEFAALTTDMAAASSDNTMMIPWEAWRDNFMQDAPEPVARAIWEQLSPEPHQVNLDKLDLKRFYTLAIPRSLIYCREDKSLGPAFSTQECHRGLDHSSWSRWTAATKSCSHARKNWPAGSSRLPRTEITLPPEAETSSTSRRSRYAH